MAGPLDWLMNDPLNLGRNGTNDQRAEEARRMQEWFNTPRSMNPPVGPNAPAARGEGTPLGFNGERLEGGPNPIARGMGAASAPVPLPGTPWNGTVPGPREMDARYPFSPQIAQSILGQGTTQLGTVPVPGFSDNQIAQTSPPTPISGTYMRYRTPTAADPSTWEHAPIPANTMLRHGSNFDLLPDTAEGRLQNHLEMARGLMRNNADEHEPNRQFRAALPGLMNSFTQAEQQRLNGIQQLGTIQGVPNGLLGRQQLEQAGSLGYRDTNGAWVPGATQNAASDALNRTRENERYGPEARYDSFYNQAYNGFPPGTPHQTRVRQLQSQGMAPPQFLTGNQGPRGPGNATPISGAGETRGTGATVPRPQPTTMNDAQGAIDAAFESGLSSFQRNPQTGQRMPVEGATAGDAITNILAAIPNDAHLRSNFPAIQSRLMEEVPGGQQAMNSWLNQTFYTNPITGNPLSSDPQRAQTIRQIRRIMALSGGRASANPGLFGYTPLGAGVGAGTDALRSALGTR